MLHVVATRLGIGIYDEAWFEYRLKLFEAITFPSIARQTNREFTWLVCVDRRMPQRARLELDRIVSGSSLVTIVELEFKGDFVNAVSDWCKRRTGGKGSVLTTRMDDDDALRIDGLELLRAMADRSTSPYAVLSFSVGARWCPVTNTAYRAYHHSLGIGLSFLEPARESRTVYSRPHLDIKGLMAPKGAYIDSVGGSEISWLYTTHALADTDKGDSARVAKIRGHKFRFTPSAEDLARFGLTMSAIDRLSELEGAAKNEVAFRISTKAISLENRIKTLRASMADAEGDELRRITKEVQDLEARRVSMGSSVVNTGG